MVRPLHPDTSAVISSEILRPAMLIEVYLIKQPLRLTSTKQDISWGGRTFLANGWLDPIDGISETTDVNNQGFEIKLSGVSQALVSLVLSNNDAGEKGTIWLALFNETGNLVGEPIRLYQGFVDTCDIDDNMSAPKITINLENELSRFDESQNFRYTDECQKSYFNGDRGFQYVPKMETWSGFWGRQERPKWIKAKKPKQ